MVPDASHASIQKGVFGSSPTAGAIYSVPTCPTPERGDAAVFLEPQGALHALFFCLYSPGTSQCPRARSMQQQQHKDHVGLLALLFLMPVN